MEAPASFNNGPDFYSDRPLNYFSSRVSYSFSICLLLYTMSVTTSLLELKTSATQLCKSVHNSLATWFKPLSRNMDVPTGFSLFTFKIVTNKFKYLHLVALLGPITWVLSCRYIIFSVYKHIIFCYDIYTVTSVFNSPRFSFLKRKICYLRYL